MTSSTPTYPHAKDDSADQEDLLVVGGAHGDGAPGEHHGRDDDGWLPTQPKAQKVAPYPKSEFVSYLSVMKPPTNEKRNAAPTVAAVIPDSQSSAFSVNKVSSYNRQTVTFRIELYKSNPICYFI